DMEEGFPGNLNVKVEFSVNADGIEISYTAKSDKDTVINLTNHTYFNLAGKAESIENHCLTLFADGFTPIDSGLIPTGEIKGVKGTPFDFRKPKLIGKDINAEDAQLIRAGGYDHNFVINGAGYRKFAEVYCEASGVKMECFTDMPGVQFYSGNFLTERKGRNGETIKKRCGFCLETQFFPNSVNEPAFPSCVLRAGEVFSGRTGYKFMQG
ncbi:MAG: galactose mutarotase, partial [Clostridia bacterium]|nr:galactose mutarotase [Clostridia bacterium]